MKNKDITYDIVRCQDCVHRKTWHCPMNEYNADLDEYYDLTDDDGFCHEGESEEDIRHNNYTQFLESLMKEMFRNA